MIYDSLENMQRYMNLHPQLAEALRYLQGEEWKQLPNGKKTLDGERLYASAQRYATFPEKPFESHERYADIQCIVSGEEIIGVAPSEDLVEKEAYDPEHDIAFWDASRPYTKLHMLPGWFVILFPGEAHAPCMHLDGEHQVHKVVLKVLWED